ncbi:MAG: hypothetical protein II010_03130, partial [Oscillospiraceae bacterium]|nr:hypothetical protein [Oscillospiraceae bacterium]
RSDWRSMSCANSRKRPMSSPLLSEVLIYYSMKVVGSKPRFFFDYTGWEKSAEKRLSNLIVCAILA